MVVKETFSLLKGIPNILDLSASEIKKYSIDHYGENCGLALQYMFNAKRNKNES